MQPETSKHIPSVTMLRGIASLAVCIMHFIGTVPSKTLNEIGIYGGYGVPIFFVISGFIIPYALYHSGYTIPNYFKFLLKRGIRLEIPYLLTILLIIVISYLAQLSPDQTIPVVEVFDRNTLYHLFYLVGFMDGQWLSPVFWTLAIEFQFYLFIGLLFPLLIHKNTGVKGVICLLLCAMPFFSTDVRYFSSYMFTFLPGILLFFFMTKQINLNLFILAGIVLLAVIYLKTGTQGLVSPLIAAGFILFVKKPIKPLMFLGTISYSIYLLHTPIGTDGIINFMQNYILSDNGRILLMLFSLPLVIYVAWVFYRIVEKPAQHLAGKIKYKNQRIIK